MTLAYAASQRPLTPGSDSNMSPVRQPSYDFNKASVLHPSPIRESNGDIFGDFINLDTSLPDSLNFQNPNNLFELPPPQAVEAPVKEAPSPKLRSRLSLFNIAGFRKQNPEPQTQTPASPDNRTRIRKTSSHGDLKAKNQRTIVRSKSQVGMSKSTNSTNLQRPDRDPPPLPKQNPSTSTLALSTESHVDKGYDKDKARALAAPKSPARYDSQRRRGDAIARDSHINPYAVPNYGRSQSPHSSDGHSSNCRSAQSHGRRDGQGAPGWDELRRSTSFKSDGMNGSTSALPLIPPTPPRYQSTTNSPNIRQEGFEPIDSAMWDTHLANAFDLRTLQANSRHKVASVVDQGAPFTPSREAVTQNIPAAASPTSILSTPKQTERNSVMNASQGTPVEKRVRSASQQYKSMDRVLSDHQRSVSAGGDLSAVRSKAAPAQTQKVPPVPSISNVLSRLPPQTPEKESKPIKTFSSPPRRSSLQPAIQPWPLTPKASESSSKPSPSQTVRKMSIGTMVPPPRSSSGKVLKEIPRSASTETGVSSYDSFKDTEDFPDSGPDGPDTKSQPEANLDSHMSSTEEEWEASSSLSTPPSSAGEPHSRPHKAHHSTNRSATQKNSVANEELDSAVEEVEGENEEEDQIPTASRLEFALTTYPKTILVALLHHLKFESFQTLMLVSKTLKTSFENESREIILQRYLGSHGYRSLPKIITPITDPEAFAATRTRKTTLEKSAVIATATHSDVVHLTLNEIESFRTGLTYSSRDLVTCAKAAAIGRLPAKKLATLKAAMRAWNKMVMRVRSQTELLPADDPRLPAYFFPKLTAAAPLVKKGRAPCLKVFVPSSNGSSWMGDDEVVECEREIWRSGIWTSVRKGDVVRNVAMPEFGNLGKLISDGKFLRDFQFTYDAVGHLPSWFDMFSYSPSYFHHVVASSSDNPVFYLCFQPFAAQIKEKLALCEDQVMVTSPQGSYAVKKFVYRAPLRATPGTILGSSGSAGGLGPGGIEVLHDSWGGKIVVETDGTAEHAAALLANTSSKVPTPWRILREKSRPGIVWLKPVNEFEKIA